ncbi:integrin alpha-9-like [Pelobates cultripes]|uniref:Integrin alpha-9-like, partial n=1 Tax=Pelobates cultripes TaxID=61616 RepID=A0AAD1W0C0_PELCU|nr:integrin alpha-9-like [Pelobates cultripes]
MNLHDIVTECDTVYKGYAVTAGHFAHPTSMDVVGGAPQDNGIGKVYIFRTDRRSGSLVRIFQAPGKKMGSYFGSSLCAVDLNADGLSDLLVGAPMFSEVRDEGQVTVYMNSGNGVLDERITLNGDNAYNAHFGESITNLGDIDDDGYPDVAIGAPMEDDYSGAVYIYHGDADGIVPQYSMRLSGRSIDPVLRMFGQSISGGVDMDKNGYHEKKYVVDKHEKKKEKRKGKKYRKKIQRIKSQYPFKKIPSVTSWIDLTTVWASLRFLLGLFIHTVDPDVLRACHAVICKVPAFRGCAVGINFPYNPK